MFKKLRIKNFKSFKDSGEVKLSPINLLLGQNSSGKSSLLQSFLIIKQTLESPYSDEPVIINGSYCSIGDFGDVTNQSKQIKSESFEFQFGLDYQREKESDFQGKFYWDVLPNEIKFDSIDFSLHIGKSKDDQTSPVVLSSSLECRIGDSEFSIVSYQDETIQSQLQSKFSIDDRVEPFIKSKRNIYAVKVNGFVQKIESVLLNKFLPDIMIIQDEEKVTQVSKEILGAVMNFLINKDPHAQRLVGSKSNSKLIHLYRRARSREVELFMENDSRLTELVEKLLNDQNLIKEDYKDELDRWKAVINTIEKSDIAAIEKILNDGVDEIEKIKKEKRGLIAKRFWNVKLISQQNIEFNACIDNLRDAFKRVYYLGPLREEPKVFYKRLGANDPLYVGQRGENVAFILKYYGKRPIFGIVPPDDPNEEWNPYNSSAIKPHSLQNAIVAWLKYIGVSKSISVNEMGKIGLTINANVYGDKDSDLLNVGVGVSQVLPLIVMGLASPISSTLIFEQPELHLHPYVQSRLGDFFASLGASGKQVIAETHSEHLIQRMRYFVAKQYVVPGNDLHVYYTQRNSMLGASEVVNVEIDRYGSIGNWPEGFCDETEKQLKAIVKAAFEID
jgi:predicted ATPase